MGNLNICCIFAGGVIENYDFINFPEESFVICADAGYKHALSVGIKPDCLIGDFDTFKGSMPENLEIIKFPPEKDDTDTMLAVKYAIAKGFKDIRIYGALGGRFDHAFANLQTLEYILRNGAEGMLIDEKNTILMQSAGKHRYNRRDGYFSVFAVSERAEGVSISGCKYCLENGCLERNFPLGVSNVITESYAEISVEKGILLICFSKD